MRCPLRAPALCPAHLRLPSPEAVPSSPRPPLPLGVLLRVRRLSGRLPAGWVGPYHPPSVRYLTLRGTFTHN